MSSFMDDIKEMRRDVKAEVILHINLTPELYSKLSGKRGKEIKSFCYNYAEENNNEFGEVFQAELDVLNRNDWAEIAGTL